MTIHDFITENKSIYRVGEGYWGKFKQAYGDAEGDSAYRQEKIWGMAVADPTPTTMPGRMDQVDGEWTWNVLPKVGQHLYLTARNIWWITTPIAHVVEVESWDSPLRFDFGDEG